MSENDNEVWQLKNKHGKTAKERIMEDIECVERIKDKADRIMLATKVLGAADFAVEFNLITYNEWETYIDRIFKLL